MSAEAEGYLSIGRAASAHQASMVLLDPCAAMTGQAHLNEGGAGQGVRLRAPDTLLIQQVLHESYGVPILSVHLHNTSHMADERASQS